MWVLTTRGREAMCQDVLDACRETGMTSPGLVVVDGGAPYSLDLPGNWTLEHQAEHTNIGPIMNRVQAERPDEPFYGWMADDCPPRSMNWDTGLIEAAGNWNIAYPDDAWQQGRHRITGKPHVTSIVCMGGDLVRAMGQWVPAGLRQLSIDGAWETIGNELGLMRYCPEIKAEHRHPGNGRRGRDDTDRANTHRGRDQRAFGEWKRSAAPQLIEAIRDRMS